MNGLISYPAIYTAFVLVDLLRGDSVDPACPMPTAAAVIVCLAQIGCDDRQIRYSVMATASGVLPAPAGGGLGALPLWRSR